MLRLLALATLAALLTTGALAQRTTISAICVPTSDLKANGRCDFTPEEPGPPYHVLERGAFSRAPLELSLSADGSRMAYSGVDESGDEPEPAFVITTRNGTVVSYEGDSRGFGDPYISPDATRIAYAETNQGGLFVRDIGTDEITRVADDALGSGRASIEWSPDGVRLAYVGRDSQTIYVIDADGEGDATQVFVTDARMSDRVVALDWSPQGDEIVLVEQRFDPQPATSSVYAVRKVSDEGGTPSDLFESGVNEVQLEGVEWSPDGETIAVFRVEYIPATFERLRSIELLPADGGGFTRLFGSLPSGPEGIYVDYGPVEWWTGPGAMFLAPNENEIVPPGESYTVRFDPLDAETVDLYLVSESQSSAGQRIRIEQDVPAAGGTFEWDVPEDLLSPSTFLIAVNVADRSEEFESARFRVRLPNRLYRVSGTVAQPEYDLALSGTHVWGFEQSDENLWPADYWERSERYYDGFPDFGADPFYATPDVRYLPLGFPDIAEYWYTPWTAWVDAFGTDATYTSLSPLLVPGFDEFVNQPDAGAFEAWRETVSPGYGETVLEAAYDSYRGVCFGLSNSMLAAFAEPGAFTSQWLPSLNGGNIASASLSDDVRDVAHALQNRTRDARFDARRDRQQVFDPATPQSVLEELKAMFERDTRDLDRVVWFSGRLTETDPNGDPLHGAHAVSPLGLEDEGVIGGVDAGEADDGVYALVFYDPNYGQDVGVMRIDSTANAWGPYDVWGGETGGGLYTGPFVSDVFTEGRPTWRPSASPSRPPPALAGDSDLISVAVVGRSSAVVAPNGDAIAYEQGEVTETLAASYIRFPITGVPGRPEGYRVPRGAYRAEVTPDEGGQARLSADWGRLRLGMERSDGVEGARDVLGLDPDGSVALTSAGGEVSFRGLVTVGAGDARLFIADSLAAAAGTGAQFQMTADSTAFAIGGLDRGQTYDLTLATSTPGETRTFYHADVGLPAGATHTVRPDWTTLGEGDVLVEVDLDGDGDPDQTITLGNEGLPVASEAPGPEAPLEFGVMARPNPARTSTTVSLSLADPSDVRVEAYDALGRRVAVLHEGPLAAGVHSVPFDASRLAPGMYIVRAVSPTATASAAVTVVR